MGIFSELVGRRQKYKKKIKHFQTVELKIKIDCDGCELKVKRALSSLSGVKTVEINRKHQKVTVTGYVEAKKVLKKAQSTGKRVEIWPYVPYNLVANNSYSFTTMSYDKKAPPGYVKRIDFINNPQHGIVDHDPFVSMFSDENPNACSVM